MTIEPVFAVAAGFASVLMLYYVMILSFKNATSHQVNDIPGFKPNCVHSKRSPISRVTSLLRNRIIENKVI